MMLTRVSGLRTSCDGYVLTKAIEFESNLSASAGENENETVPLERRGINAVTATANLHTTGLVAGLPDLDPISDHVYATSPAVEGPCKAPVSSGKSSTPSF
jgi:hypothetical protein